MVGRAAQGNPWTLSEIVDGTEVLPSRADVAAELILFVRETAKELGEQRASSFLKKFYGWYLRRGRFPRPFVQELVRLDSTEQVVERLLVVEPAAAATLARLEAEAPDSEGTLVPLPISAYGGG
jgi:tRNA-dihydrouridine synthase